MIIWTLINSIILMTILMGIGYYLRSKKILSDDGEKTLTYMLVNITSPAMLINAMNIEFSIDQVKTGVMLLGLSLFFIVLLIVIGNIFSFKIEEPEKKKIMRYSVVQLNGGFMGFPMAYQIYGSQGMFYATMFHIPNVVCMWTYGISTLLGNKKMSNKDRLKSMFLNPGMFGIYIGMFLFVTQMPLPLFASNLLDMLTNATTVLSMVIIGSKIATIGIKESFIDKKAFYATAFRLLISPILMIIILKFLNFDTMVEQIYVLYSALPVAVLMPILAQKYGGDVIYGSKIVVISHLICLVTIPLFFWLYSVI